MNTRSPSSTATSGGSSTQLPNNTETREVDTWRCHKDEDCGEPHGIAKCNLTSGVCQCKLPLCHDYINTTNKCVLKDCHKLEVTENGLGCTNRGARSKETAMYLTIISFTGAQNFYLRNWAQAVPQLIGFLIILISCGGCLCTFGSFCKRVMKNDIKTEDIKNKLTRGCFLQVMTIMVAVAEIGWMMADFIMIGLDGKLDGDGCPLDDGTVELIQSIAVKTVELGGGCR